MRSKLGFAAGIGLGYVLGAKAGRERYDQIRNAAQKFVNSSAVQNAKSEAQHQATHLYSSTKDKVSHKISETNWIPGRARNHEAPPEYVTDVANDAWAAATGPTR